MRILSLSLDAHILDKESVVASRVRAYGEAVDFYTVIVPARIKTSFTLSENVHVYGVSGFTKLGVFLYLFFCARRLLTEKNFGVITTQDAYFLGLLGVLLSWLYGCGLEVQAHGIEKDTLLRRTLARFVYGRADIVRTVSTRLKTILIERYCVAEQDIVVIPVFVDVTALELSATGISREQQELFKKQYRSTFSICSVGRLVPIKNVVLQLRALARVHKKFPQVHLHVVGEGGEKASLLTEADTLGLSDIVTFHGYTSGKSLGALYQRCDTFVHTADSEGYGMVLVEALHAGLAIATTDVGCVGDIIHDEKNALVIPVGDADALTEALLRLIESPELCVQLRVSAQETIKKLQTFPEIISLYISVWKSIEK